MMEQFRCKCVLKIEISPEIITISGDISGRGRRLRIIAILLLSVSKCTQNVKTDVIVYFLISFNICALSEKLSEK